MNASPRIGLDLLCLSGERTGMGWQAWWLARLLPELAPDFRFVFFLHEGADPPSRQPNVDVVRVPAAAHRGARIVAEQWHLPRIAERQHLDLLHTIAFGSPALYDGLRILTMHDLGFRIHPETAPLNYRLYWNWAYGPAARGCRRIIAVSESTKAQIVTLLNRRPDDIAVVHCGVDPAFCMDNRATDAEQSFGELGLPPRYILFVGTRQPRKDLDTLFRTFAQIHERAADVHLVIAGARGWGYDDDPPQLRELRIESHVHLSGFVPQRLMPDLYRNARLLLFPSRHEGFGLPLLEAMSSGTPVVAADNSAIPEVTGDAALLAPTGDAESLARHALSVLEEPELRSALIEKGRERAGQFSWKTAARKTLDVYRTALGLPADSADKAPAMGELHE